MPESATWSCGQMGTVWAVARSSSRSRGPSVRASDPHRRSREGPTRSRQLHRAPWLAAHQMAIAEANK